jgi:uncharacterized protein (DUF2141 family)
MRIRCEVFLVFTVVLLTGSGLPQTQTSQPNTIRVEIGGLRNNSGRVSCALYSSADGFPKNNEKAVAQLNSVISDRRAVCEFTGIEPATYAVSVFHDENSNGKLDTNFMGIPREGVGASNGARGHMGPPKFEDATFQFAGGHLDLKITVAYL